MKKRKINHKKCKFTYIKITVSTLFLCMLAVKGFTPLERTGKNLFHVQVNGREVGTVSEEALAEELLVQARRNLALSCEGMMFMEADIVVEGEEVLWGAVDSTEEVLHQMEAALQLGVYRTLNHSYTLKVNELMLSFSEMEDIQTLLQTAIDRYDSEGRFQVELVQDGDRKIGALTARVADASREEEEELRVCMGAGIQNVFSDIAGQAKGWNYQPGIQEMGFSDKIEIGEAYLPVGETAELSEAVEQMFSEQEAAGRYRVEEGDVLSVIALKVNTPASRIVELNDSLEDENSLLHIGDELYVEESKQVLSVTRVEETFYEESYEAAVVYIDNDSWYTNQTQVVRQPSAGCRRIHVRVYYENDQETGRDILDEEILQQAVAKIVERGTKALPTYIKPVTGGVLSSGFGGRNAPTRGASTNHKGVDWAVPTGTAVYASCGGTVSKAGWGSGYGYVIYIEHEDGTQTRYGHLSKVQVEVGQKVGQGEQIALSGSTGNVTGPHLHFEILIGGTQVDPTGYLE